MNNYKFEVDHWWYTWTIGMATDKFLGLRRILSWISPNLREKYYVRLLPKNFLPQRSWSPFCVFLQGWAPYVQIKQRWTPFSPRFSRIFFDKSKLLGVRLHPRLLLTWATLSITGLRQILAWVCTAGRWLVILKVEPNSSSENSETCKFSILGV